MKRCFIIGVAFFIMLSSCSITSKMHNKTINNKLVNRLIESNGNVFYINSTYIIISYVWTYDKDNVVIYKLKKGKVIDTKMFTAIGVSVWIKTPPTDDYFELDSCMELDGDMFGYWIKDGENIKHKDYPINLECFRNGTYKSDFINKIVRDINEYKIKW